jgi:hypothetical protein
MLPRRVGAHLYGKKYFSAGKEFFFPCYLCMYIGCGPVSVMAANDKGQAPSMPSENCQTNFHLMKYNPLFSLYFFTFAFSYFEIFV